MVTRHTILIKCKIILIPYCGYKPPGPQLTSFAKRYLDITLKDVNYNALNDSVTLMSQGLILYFTKVNNFAYIINFSTSYHLQFTHNKRAYCD